MTIAPRALENQEVVRNSDGQALFVRMWRPSDVPRATIVICHGFNAHSGLYTWAATQLVADGYAVYGLDLRGRGRSEGERLFARSFDDYVDDLSAVIAWARGREPNLPIFLLGHSVGGVVACTYALSRQDELAGLICESFAYRIPAPALAIAIIKLIGTLWPHLPLLRLKNKDFSRDPVVVAALNADPLIVGETQPAGTAAALARADERLRRSFSEITVPVLILHGTADKVTLPAGSQEFFERVGSADKSLKLYPDYVHDLLADKGKEAVMEDLKAWLKGRYAPVEPSQLAS